MAVTYTISGENFGDIKLSNRELMRELGSLAVSRIRRRTESGRGVDGTSFRPLSQGYAKQKQEALGHSRADLTVSGRMLNDMQPTEVTERSVSIGFVSTGSGVSGGTFIQRSRSVGAADKAFYHQEGGRVVRPFFGLSSDDETALEQAVERYLEKVTNT
jgi:phage gpG-like protein